MEKSIDKKIPRGYKNANPGNIRKNGDRWQGLRAVQSDPDFFQFQSMPWGYRALIRTLQNYRRVHGLRTIEEMISRWAPPSENSTADYVSAVCRDLQVPASHEPDVDDRETMTALAAAISRVENGQPADMADVERGWELL